MSSEVYFGEVDCRRLESLQCAIEQLTAALMEKNYYAELVEKKYYASIKEKRNYPCSHQLDVLEGEAYLKCPDCGNTLLSKTELECQTTSSNIIEECHKQSDKIGENVAQIRTKLNEVIRVLNRKVYTK